MGELARFQHPSLATAATKLPEANGIGIVNMSQKELILARLKSILPKRFKTARKKIHLPPRMVGRNPPVSCICFYTGSPARLEEAIYSFLQQDYQGRKELVIINDDPKVSLQFTHPEVTIVDLPKKFYFVRAKWQKAVTACAHNLLLIWSADDISLPHRISLTTEKWSAANETFPFTPETIFIWENERVQGPYHNLFNQGCAWSRRLFMKVDGIKKSKFKNTLFVPQLKSIDAPPLCKLDPDEVYYLFRGINYVTESRIKPVGTIQLQPKWRQEYSSAVRTQLATQNFTNIDRKLSSLTHEEKKTLNRYGAVNLRRYYLFADREMAYISTAKVACTSLKTAMMEPYGIHEQVHKAWPHIHRGTLPKKHQGLFTFSFVRNPFDRLVSGYRNKIFGKPLEVDYFGNIPTNISFTAFVHEVVKRPDCLINGHFQSQYFKLYQDGELLVDYLGRFENLSADWQFIANRFQFSPELPHRMKSRYKSGAHRDYRDYYTEELVHLVYHRFQPDFEAFGYQESYEALLAYVNEKNNIE